MNRIHNQKLLSRAQELRKNMTKEERNLWYDFLKDYPAIILRQKIIGNYIADFYCPKAKLVIEVDGFQHELDPDIVKSDEERTKFFSEMGIAVFRIKNSDINKQNFAHICNEIDKQIKKRITWKHIQGGAYKAVSVFKEGF